MFRIRIFAAVLLLMAIFSPVLRTTSAAASSDDANCFGNSATGSAHVHICISSHGNVSTFQAGDADYFPSTAYRGEGYALCSDAGNTVHAWDAGDDEAGWGEHTSQDPGPVITRYTSDGDLKLVQSYAFNLAEGEVKITMELKNVGDVSLPHVIISRYFSPTLPNPGGRNEGVGLTESSTSLWYGDHPGLKLNAASWDKKHETSVDFRPEWEQATEAGCNPGTQEVALNGTPLVGRVNYNIGTLNPGDKKTVVYKYERL